MYRGDGGSVRGVEQVPACEAGSVVPVCSAIRNPIDSRELTSGDRTVVGPILGRCIDALHVIHLTQKAYAYPKLPSDSLFVPSMQAGPNQAVEYLRFQYYSQREVCSLLHLPPNPLPLNFHPAAAPYNAREVWKDMVFKKRFRILAENL